MGDLPPTIVVRLTPPGRGAVATLRVEGPRAVEAVQSQWESRGGRRLQDCARDRPLVGHFGGAAGEEVVVRLCGNGTIEIHCHGGLAAVTMIEESLVVAGCRCVGWREWVAQEEADSIAVDARLALAEARTERTAAILLDQLNGALRQAVEEIRQAIDRGDQAMARRQIDGLLMRADLGRHLVRRWRVVLTGRPNVGKSSLLNALAGHQRAIVHDQPGTTRDAVTVATAVGGWPVEFCDTAGLRAAGDELEAAGVALAQERVGEADLVLLLSDESAEWSEEDQALRQRWPAAVLVHNKCDLPQGAGARPDGLRVSAVEGHGIEKLLDAISRRLVPDPPGPGAAVPFTAGQMAMVRRLAEELDRNALD